MREIAEAAWECADPGMQYDTTINRWHTAPNSGRINASNPCSEYMHLDNSACNLASINLLHYLDDDGNFDVAALRAHRRGDVHRPGDPGRQRRLPDREDRGEQPQVPPARARVREPRRAPDGAEPALRLRRRPGVGGGDHRADDRSRLRDERPDRGSDGPVRGLRRQPRRDAQRAADAPRRGRARSTRSSCPTSSSTPRSGRGTKPSRSVRCFGVRNSQSSVLAPTGTIGLMMDCDTTGIEPDLALTKAKKLVGGGTMFIVNQTIPRALRNLGYSDDQVDAIVAYIDEHKSIIGAPGFNPEHLPVFACSMGDNTIDYMGHVKMMAAVQPFISGAISKCVVGDTLLTTVDGLVRIGSACTDGEAPDCFRDEVIEVASLGGDHRRPTRSTTAGLRPVREVVLRSGHRVVGTPEPPASRRRTAGLRLESRRSTSSPSGDCVAVRYGDETVVACSRPASTTSRPTAAYGSTEDRADPGRDDRRSSRSCSVRTRPRVTLRGRNWTVTITNSVDAVLERVAAAWRAEFGVDARIVRPGRPVPARDRGLEDDRRVPRAPRLRCAGVREAHPDAVLRSPREMVLAFLQGLALDAYVTVADVLRSGRSASTRRRLLDDLQAVLTNLGVVHSRVVEVQRGRTTRPTTRSTRPARTHSSWLRLGAVPRARQGGAGRASCCDSCSTDGTTPPMSSRHRRRVHSTSCSRRVGAVARARASGRASRVRVPLRPAHPPRQPAHAGARRRRRLASCCRRGCRPCSSTTSTSARSSPSATPAMREVFDVSVPTTHAFVGNGIVNHNTVNMPEEVTVDDVENLHIESWRLGLKAVALYRDNCKVGQPLSTQKKAAADATRRSRSSGSSRRSSCRSRCARSCPGSARRRRSRSGSPTATAT